MSTAVVKCACCGDDTEEGLTRKDPDLGVVCLAHCYSALQWAHAHLRRKTPKGVSITGIHGPREQPIPWDPAISQAELDKLNKGGK